MSTEQNIEKNAEPLVRFQQWTSAVLRVGDGRGFVVNRLGYFGPQPVVITAAHCLADACLANGNKGLPLCHPGRCTDDETYEALLGPLSAGPTVWASCLFVDPIADIAVLGRPDDQVLIGGAAAFDTLMNSAAALTVADAPVQGSEAVTGFRGYRFETSTPGKGPAYVLSLDGRWLQGQVMRRDGWLTFEPARFFVGGMSGSPIINAAGAAIGVVSVDHRSPVLVDSLSTQLLRSIRAARKRARARRPAA